MVKNLFISLIILSVSPFQCTSVDDFPRVIRTVEQPDLIEIEDNKNVFSIDEDIVIEATIPNNVVSVEGKKLLLSDYLDKDQEKIQFWLYAYTDGDDTKLKGVSIAEAEAEVGNVFYEGIGYGMSISAVFDKGKNAFVSRVKFKLAESGTYYIGGGYYDSYKDDQQVRIYLSNNVNEEVHVYTSIKNSNESGVYKFTIE